MADAAPAPAAEKEAEPKKGGLPTVLLLVNAVLLVAVIGVGVWIATKKPATAAAASEGESAKEGHGEAKEGHGDSKEGHGEKKEAKEGGGHEGGHEAKSSGGGGSAPPGAGPTLRLADFVVHLRNPEADRYARFSFEIEVATDKDKETLTARTAQVRDAFIMFLSDRTVEELRGGAGLDKLKQALFERLLEVAKDCHVRNLFITDFVLQ
jgi:flagellar protein FliL